MEADSPAADALLDEIAPLTHHDRMRRMVELGRRAASRDAEAIAIIEALAAKANPYARLLAIQTVFGSRDGARLVAALSDASSAVRRRARWAAPVFCDDAQMEAALSKTPRGRALASMASRLRQRGRTHVVDAFLAKKLDDLSAAAPARFDGKIVDLIPYGSAEAQAAHAEALREAGSPTTWVRTAVWQPAVAADSLIALLTADAPLDPRAWWKVRTMLPALATHRPAEALRVAQSALRKTGDPTEAAMRGVLAVLAQRLPAETFDLLREVHESSRPAPPPGAFGVVRFETHTERLGVERLAYLVRLGGGPLPDGKKGFHWFMRLSPEDRERLARVWATEGRGSWGAFLLRQIAPEASGRPGLREKAYVRWKEASMRADGSIDPRHLEWLPRDLRVREARRHLDRVTDLVTKPRVRMQYAQLLPFADAKDALAPWLGHPEGEERAAALQCWIGSVKLDRASLPDALAAVKARKFEQDPVRRAMLVALRDLPLAVFEPAHLPDVGQIVKDALDAADLSPATANTVEALLVRLFRKDAAWGAKQLAKLIAARGTVSALGLGDGLTAKEVEALAPAIAGLVPEWLTRERAGALFWLAASFGKRLPLLPDLALALELCAQDLPLVDVAQRAVALLARNAPRRFAALVPKLLEADRTFAIVPQVARHVSLKRQDLLDPLLGDGPMKGRFATGKTSWVIDFGAGHARWTDRQQAKHARSLRAIAEDAARGVPEVLAALDELVGLAFVEPAAVLALASDARPPVRERAVRWLPRLDGGEGLPVLIECLGDARARFAIYALRNAFAEMDPASVLATLRKAPFGKVTVAKEVLRLTGEIPGEEAFRTLVSFDRPDLHRDVRIALLRAMWDHLDRPEGWAIFERAAKDPDWVVVSRLADIPLGRLSASAEARVAQLLARVLERPEVDARIDLLKRIVYVPLRDAERALFSACLLRMAGPHPEESKAATDAVLQRMHPSEADTVVHRMSELALARRLLLVFIERVNVRLTPHATPTHIRVGHGLLGVLRADDRLVPQAIGLAPRLLEWKELADVLQDLAARDLLHADAMSAAIVAVASTLHPDDLEERLAAASDPRLRRLAVAALVHAARPGQGWSHARRERLAGYQADVSPLVAGAAELVFPPD